jgi:flagellin
MRKGDIGSIATATSANNLTGIIDGSGATFATAAAGLVSDYSTVPATLGTSTIQVTTAAADTDSLVVNGVTFTFADANTGDTATVVDATNVTITRDITGTALTADTTASALAAGIAAYKADANVAYTAFDDVTAAASTDTVTLIL